jgi:hypothetical protein
VSGLSSKDLRFQNDSQEGENERIMRPGGYWESDRVISWVFKHDTGLRGDGLWALS